MNRRIASLLVSLAATAVVAEDRALVTDDDIWKMQTTPQVKVSEAADDTVTFLGGSIGWILNDRISFSAAGYVTPNEVDGQGGTFVDKWEWWYTGVDVGYIFAPEQLVHLSLNALFGAGQISIEDQFARGDDTEGFFVFEPGAAVCVNLWKDIELGLGVSYRLIEGAADDDIDDGDLSGVVGDVFLRVTEF